MDRSPGPCVASDPGCECCHVHVFGSVRADHEERRYLTFPIQEYQCTMREKWKYKGRRVFFSFGDLECYYWYGPIIGWQWNDFYKREIPQYQVHIEEVHMYRLKTLGAGSQ